MKTGVPEIQAIKDKFAGKLLVEVLKTKINRNKIFWVGTSKIDDSIRIGIETATGRTYFLTWEDFLEDPRIQDLEVMTPSEANALEKKIQEAKKKPK